MTNRRGFLGAVAALAVAPAVAVRELVKPKEWAFRGFLEPGVKEWGEIKLADLNGIKYVTAADVLPSDCVNLSEVVQQALREYVKKVDALMTGASNAD